MSFLHLDRHILHDTMDTEALVQPMNIDGKGHGDILCPTVLTIPIAMPWLGHGCHALPSRNARRRGCRACARHDVARVKRALIVPPPAASHPPVIQA
jgi:hypothetical protein